MGSPIWASPFDNRKPDMGESFSFHNGKPDMGESF
jgi:hypothetical protein